MRRPIPAAPTPGLSILPIELPITGLEVELSSKVLRISVWTERSGLVQLLELPYTQGVTSKSLRELANEAYQRAYDSDLKQLTPRALEHVG
jgi:hypothetical protein